LSNYKHIFFDLDHTLWDFKTNSRLTLSEIFVEFGIADLSGTDEEDFIETYERYNHKMWDDYRNGRMSKETLRYERFRQSLFHLGVRDIALINQIADFYVDTSPIKTALFPGTIEVLTELRSKYVMHIITNGFEEIQTIKLNRSGLSGFFDEVITSEQAGSKKPHPAIFEYSLKRANAKVKESLMVGDNQQVDIGGAKKVGMDGVFFNPEKEETVINPTFEVSELKQMLTFL